MKKLGIGACVLALMTAGVAKADEPVDWTGFYAGVFAGYGGGDPDWSFPNSGTGISQNFGGAIGGVLVGYNQQVGSIVIGAEADIGLIDGTSSSDCPVATVECRVDYDWMATIRAKAGVPFNRALIYATGGAVGARGTGQGIRYSDGAVLSSSTSTEWGWTVGGGVEVAVRENINLRGEALYFDLGTASSTDGIGNPVNIAVTGYQVRAALVFRFPQ